MEDADAFSPYYTTFLLFEVLVLALTFLIYTSSSSPVCFFQFSHGHYHSRYCTETRRVSSQSCQEEYVLYEAHHSQSLGVSPNVTLCIVSNPCDLMTAIAAKVAGPSVPAGRFLVQVQVPASIPLVFARSFPKKSTLMHLQSVYM